MSQSNTAKLADILNRVLAKGVSLSGDVTLSVADVDLVYLGLRLMLSSIGTLEREASTANLAYLLPTPADTTDHGPGQRPSAHLQVKDFDATAALVPLADQRINADPENSAKSLVQLVLTITNLLRDLMEKQALRRVDSGQLSDAQVERLGTTFMLLEQRMQDLKTYFGLQDDDLDIGLPIGDL
jgi:Gas vesicle protein K/Gas vesicle protein